MCRGNTFLSNSVSEGLLCTRPSLLVVVMRERSDQVSFGELFCFCKVLGPTFWGFSDELTKQ